MTNLVIISPSPHRNVLLKYRFFLNKSTFLYEYLCRIRLIKNYCNPRNLKRSVKKYLNFFKTKMCYFRASNMTKKKNIFACSFKIRFNKSFNAEGYLRIGKSNKEVFLGFSNTHTHTHSNMHSQSYTTKVSCI